MPFLAMKAPVFSSPSDSFPTSLSGKAPLAGPTDSWPSVQALTMNGGKQLEDEGAVQDYHLAPRGRRPAGEVVPHLAAACRVKAEDTRHQMSIVRTLSLLLSLRGSCLSGGHVCSEDAQVLC